MENIGLIFDSSCGKSKEYIESKGGFFLPIEITINNQKYLSGKNLDCIEMSKILTENSTTSTAACSYGDITKIFTEAVMKFDKVVYVSLSKYLSSTNSTAKTVMKNEGFEEKIIVIDSNFASPWLENIVDELFEMTNKNDVNRLIEFVNLLNDNLNGYIAPGSLKFLNKGGRINKAQYVLGTIAKIVPVIPFVNGRLDLGVERFKSKEKAKTWVIEELMKKIDELRENKWMIDYKFIVLASPVEHEELEKTKQILINQYKIQPESIITHYLSPEIYAHIGPSYWGIGLIPIF